MEVGDEIVEFGLPEDCAEGRHLLASRCDLGTNLAVIEAAAYSGEIGTFGAALMPDGVALVAAAIGEDECSASALTILGLRSAAGGEAGRRRE